MSYPNQSDGPEVTSFNEVGAPFSSPDPTGKADQASQNAIADMGNLLNQLDAVK